LFENPPIGRVYPPTFYSEGGGEGKEGGHEEGEEGMRKGEGAAITLNLQVWLQLHAQFPSCILTLCNTLSTIMYIGKGGSLPIFNIQLCTAYMEH